MLYCHAMRRRVHGIECGENDRFTPDKEKSMGQRGGKNRWDGGEPRSHQSGGRCGNIPAGPFGFQNGCKQDQTFRFVSTRKGLFI